jgi:hypothetical protein
MTISIDVIEYAIGHKIVYRITRSTNICGSIEAKSYNADNEKEVHKTIDHYLHAADHNLHHYKDCPWCRDNLLKDGAT